MKRREFMATAAAASLAPTMTKASVLTSGMKEVSWAAKTIAALSPVHRSDEISFFMMGGLGDKKGNELEDRMSFSIERFYDDQIVHISKLESVLENCEKIYPRDETETSLIDAVEEASKSIFENSLRGRGNRLIFVDDGAYVWYEGVSPFDVPLKFVDDEHILPNPNIEKYFAKIFFDIGKVKTNGKFTSWLKETKYLDLGKHI